MVQLFIDGILLVFIVSLSIGPAFFATIQTGINRGFKYGAFFSFGVLLSDISLVIISYLIGARLFDDPKSKVFIGLIGGIILIIFGSVSWAKKPDILKRRNINYKTPLKQNSLLAYPLKGFFLNIINPFLFVFWFGALGFVGKLAPEGELLRSTVIFFSGTFTITISADLLKSYIGNKIKNFLNPRKELLLNKIVGIALVIFGIALIFRTLNEYGFFDYIMNKL